MENKTGKGGSRGRLTIVLSQNKTTTRTQSYTQSAENLEHNGIHHRGVDQDGACTVRAADSSRLQCLAGRNSGWHMQNRLGPTRRGPFWTLQPSRGWVKFFC